jgi:hypothetical protein
MREVLAFVLSKNKGNKQSQWDSNLTKAQTAGVGLFETLDSGRLGCYIL